MRSRILNILIPLTAAAITLYLLRCAPAPYRVPPKAGVRIATYNVMFLHAQENPERIQHLQTVISEIDPDIIGFQEVAGSSILQKIVGPNYRIGMIEDSGDAQKLAIAVKRPFELRRVSLLFSGAAFEDYFPNERDVLRAEIADGKLVLTVFVVHFKSRNGGRTETDYRRIGASRTLLDYLRHNAEPNPIVLGDFNDTPDDESVNILETGNPNAKGGMVDASGNFLYNCCQPLWNRDECTLEMYVRFRGRPLDARVRAARADNDRLRGKHYRYPQDVTVIQSLFDQILISPALASTLVDEAHIYTGEAGLSGMKSETTRNPDGTSSSKSRGALASDHLPVFIDLRIQH